jgi:hypothetical protein
MLGSNTALKGVYVDCCCLQAGSEGGAVRVTPNHWSEVVISRSSFKSNRAVDYGGALDIADCDVIITQCFFKDNVVSCAWRCLHAIDGVLLPVLFLYPVLSISKAFTNRHLLDLLISCAASLSVQVQSS